MSKKNKSLRAAKAAKKVVTTNATTTTTKPEETKVETAEVTKVIEEAQAEVKKETPTETKKVEKVEVTETTKQKPKKEGEYPPKTNKKEIPTEPPVEDVVPEVVIPPKNETKPTNDIVKGYKVNSLKHLADGDRISADAGITLMNLIHKRYLSNPDLPENFKKAISNQFDAMALAHLIHWNEQTVTELTESGIKVNEEIFDAISEGLATYFNIQVKALPTGEDKQLKIQFDTPEEVKQEVQNTERAKKNGPLPTYSADKKEEEVVSDLETIMAASNGMGPNLENAIIYAKKAFNMEKEEPAKVLCAIMGKLTHSNVLLNGYGRSIFGSMTINDSPFTGIALLKKHLPKWKDQELIALSRLFFSLGAQINLNALNKSKKENEKIAPDAYLKPFNTLFKSLNDKIINDIINTIDNPANVVAVPKTNGLSTDNFNCEKIISQLKTAYGAQLNKKQIKEIMSKTLNSFQKEEINPFSTYVEKGYSLID